MSNTFILRWSDTKHGKQPKPQEVELWLTLNGFEPTATPKVYANGDVQLSCKGDPEAAWANFMPPLLTIEDKLSGYVKALVAERAVILARPEGSRTSIERGMLAIMGLVLYGYGIEVE